MSEKRIEAEIVGGPIELQGYEFLTLAVNHTAILPNGKTMQIPAGTKLIMNDSVGGTGIKYEGGTASKAVAPISIEA